MKIILELSLKFHQLSLKIKVGETEKKSMCHSGRAGLGAGLFGALFGIYAPSATAAAATATPLQVPAQALADGHDNERERMQDRGERVMDELFGRLEEWADRAREGGRDDGDIDDLERAIANRGGQNNQE